MRHCNDKNTFQIEPVFKKWPRADNKLNPEPIISFNMFGRICLSAAISLGIVFGSVADIHPKSYLFHAAKKRVAQKIRQRGFSVHKMNPKTRFGKGVYFSRSPRTALKEKGRSNAMIRVETTKRFRKNTINLIRPSRKKIKTYAKARYLRGTVKRNVIGPKIGKRIGRYAGKKGKIIRYQSVKVPNGVNFFVPRATYIKNKNVVKNIRIKDNRRYH